MTDLLYSIRMRASANGAHISGSERLVSSERAEGIIRDMCGRAVSRGVMPDDITITVDPMTRESIQYEAALDFVSVQVSCVHEGRSFAVQMLEHIGVAPEAARYAVHIVGSGAAPSGANMRGAVIMDAQNGVRLEQDQERGVRVSRFDWTESAHRNVNRALSSAGFPHFRTQEALALASKVARAPGVLAELCWSDDPDYTAGYVSSARAGYMRIPFMKKPGDAHGGRVFFVDAQNTRLDVLITYLQSAAVLIRKVGSVRNSVEPHWALEHYASGSTHVRA